MSRMLKRTPRNGPNPNDLREVRTNVTFQGEILLQVPSCISDELTEDIAIAGRVADLGPYCTEKIDMEDYGLEETPEVDTMIERMLKYARISGTWTDRLAGKCYGCSECHCSRGHAEGGD